MAERRENNGPDHQRDIRPGDSKFPELLRGIRVLPLEQLSHEKVVELIRTIYNQIEGGQVGIEQRVKLVEQDLESVAQRLEGSGNQEDTDRAKKLRRLFPIPKLSPTTSL